MAEKPESNPKLLHVIIPAATTLLVALIGLGTAIYQTDKPIQLTAAAQTEQALTATFSAPTAQAETAMAPSIVAQTVQAAFAATQAAQTALAPNVPPPTSTPQPTTEVKTQIPPPATSTAFNPTISITNKLLLPVKIFIDDVYQSDLGNGDSSTFTLASYPVVVKWSVIKQTTSKGMPLGHDMSGSFDDIKVGDEITIDNVVENQPYFYPLISNTSGVDCTVTINKGWKSEYDTGAIASAFQNNVGFGYYELYNNSNVTLDCAGQIYWWGLLPDETKGTSFYDQVEKDTGAIYFTLQP